MAIRGDNPIDNPADDLIGREAVAAIIAEELRTVDASEGCVIAVMGPWGSGKTSLVNLVRNELAKEPALPVLDFNPWMFSGTEQLVESFFRELSAQLHLKKGRLEDIASDIEAYGDLLSPVGDILTILGLLPGGGAIGKVRNAAGAVKRLKDRRKLSATEQRKKLAGELAKLEHPLVVVVDDIDRLSTSEIRDIFKLVRLTASFPNVIYLVAFDRLRVEDALTEKGIEGRSYLEKIVQVSFDIPVLPQGVLWSQLLRALSDALEDLGEQTRFDEDRWPDVVAEIVLPLIRNMRDVRRYCASVRGTVRALTTDIELVDVLALEAVRVFLPDVYSKLASTREALTQTGMSAGSSVFTEQVKQLIEAGGKDANVVSALIERLFPAAERYLPRGSHYEAICLGEWITARRVAHPDILSLYLERIAGEALSAFTDAERAFTMLDDETALDLFLRSIDLNRLEDVIAALENYQGHYSTQAVAPAATVLLNLIPILPERPRGFLGLDARMVVGRVVLRLLRQLPSPDDVERVVREVLPKLSSFSSRFDLIHLVGYQEGAGHKLISQTSAGELETELADAVHAAVPAELAREWDLFRLLFWLQSKLPEGTPVLPTTDDLELNAAILLRSRTEIRSQGQGTRRLTRKQRLQWEILVKLYSDEETLDRAIQSLETSQPTEQPLIDAIELAKRYLGGWHPRPFDDED